MDNDRAYVHALYGCANREFDVERICQASDRGRERHILPVEKPFTSLLEINALAVCGTI